MLQSGVSSQNRVVRLDHSGGHLRSGVDRELKLGLLAVVDGKTLHQKGGESGTSTASKGMEEKKSLKSRTLVSQFPDPVQNQIHNLLTDSVMASGVVISRIFLARDHLNTSVMIPIRRQFY